MAEKLGGVNGISGAALEFKARTENPDDKGVLSGGIEVTEDKAMVDESSSESVTSRIEMEGVEMGRQRISNVHNVTRNRVIEMSCQDDDWRSTRSVICMVERLLQGKFGLHDEEEANNFEKGWDRNLVKIPCEHPWNRETERPVSEIGTAMKETVDLSCPDVTVSSSAEQDSGSNEVVQEGKLENVVEDDGSDGALIPKLCSRNDVTEKEGEYYLSDLVWGKVRSHPWWPGQIFHPSAASDRARKYFKRDSYLIAYFGDQSFAWNEASKIKPFRMVFSEMEKQSSGDHFRRAVDSAVDEFARRVERGLSCSCLPPDLRLNSEAILNAGIRGESSVVARSDHFPTASLFLPDELVQSLGFWAQSPQKKANRLQLMAAKAQLSAFKRWRYNCRLPVLETFGPLFGDENRTGVEAEVLNSVKVSGGTDATPSRKRKSTSQNSSSRKRRFLSRAEAGGSSFRKPRKMKTLLAKLPALDLIISNLTSVAKSPIQGHHHMVKTPMYRFFCQFRNSVCIEEPEPRKRKPKKPDSVEKTATEVFPGVDSYWADRINQSCSRDQSQVLLMVPDGGGMKLVPEDVVVQESSTFEMERLLDAGTMASMLWTA